MRFVSAFLTVLIAGLTADEPWILQDSGTKARLRGISVVSKDVAWASGSQGTCLRTTDGGDHWQKVVVPDSSGLDFRDIQAFDERTATLLSIGSGELSRIYRTVDGGANWTLQYTNRDPKGFLDAIAFWDADHGLALGDPVDGRYVILTTDDGGRTWSRIADAGMPEALPSEGAFAASGTCLVTQGSSNAWFGTGGGASSRVFRSTDRGRTWAVSNTPIRAGNASSGIFSLAFRDADHGIAVGGDYKSPEDKTATLATSDDGGRTWTSPDGSSPFGYRSAVAFVPGREGPTIVTVGPSGTSRSRDGGRTWSFLRRGFHAISFGGTGDAHWAVGENGLIGRLSISY
jgi:photosystem II stability/assembly factor-like uncharacterized protein